MRAFCYKQLVHCSIVGGGVFTASTLQITHHLGAWPLLDPLPHLRRCARLLDNLCVSRVYTSTMQRNM